FGNGPPEGLICILNYVRDKSRVQQGPVMYFGYKYGPTPCNQGTTVQYTSAHRHPFYP
ncbi:Os12g0244000, partial [Oryza sativa Japonica Group]